MTSPRVYIYGITYEDTYEFLHTALDKRGCVEYIQSHRKLFKDRFKSYTYGQMCNEKNTWEVIENV